MNMLVMDDGWFGKRNNDQNSLGDWFVNEDKLKGGLGELIRRINALGLQFGIWYEPEMISPDSDLFRAHPDWRCVHVPNRKPCMAGISMFSICPEKRRCARQHFSTRCTPCSRNIK